MPIRVLDELPAVNFLREENVFVMTTSRASGQEIRPLKNRRIILFCAGIAMANFHAIVNLPGLLTKMGVKYRRFSTIET
ncbi:homoserine O-succinyltransferase, partial [Salmonella enterica subsp. enterica serovar Anatum]|nr:homoserine O-succinyltransferase [Salmonella enterica subsp. enterica serovar Anatum]